MLEEFMERPHENEKDRALFYISQLLEEARSDKENRGEDIRSLEEVQRLLHAKKYGLVWEEHAEKVEEEMKTKIPVFIEEKSKKINDNPNSEDFNFILEGDNLHSLHLLEKTHTNRIDVIYIDPPYNTGNRDFKYNDAFVDKNDLFSHSKWLSFMERRLSIAKRLLAEDGVILISIDENEYSHLKLLMDEIFGEYNFITNFIWQSTPGSNTGNEIKTVTESILVYSKVKSKRKIGSRPVVDNSKYKFQDEYVEKRGKYLLNKLDRRMTGSHYSEALNYPITMPNGEKLYPGNSTEKQHFWNWRWSQTKLQWGIDNGFIEIKKGKNGWAVYFKQYQFVNNKDEKIERSLPFQNLINDQDGLSSATGTREVMNIFGEKKFDYPKPINLIKYILPVHPDKNGIVLDFFAGSGTTGQAVVELNAEYGGNRKFILATNNENKIAEEITFERLKRVSSGTDKYIAHPMNLKYLKTDFIEKNDSDLEFSLLENVRALIELTYGLDLSSSEIAIITKRTELKSLDLSNLSIIYMRSQTHKMLDRMQRSLLKDIKIIDIPETFFPKELREAGL